MTKGEYGFGGLYGCFGYCSNGGCGGILVRPTQPIDVAGGGANIFTSTPNKGCCCIPSIRNIRLDPSSPSSETPVAAESIGPR